MLAVKGADTEEVTKLIMATTEPAGGDKTSEATHTSYPSLDAAVILLQPIVQVDVHGFEGRVDRDGVYITPRAIRRTLKVIPSYGGFASLSFFILDWAS
jgi:hypothetical protein